MRDAIIAEGCFLDRCSIEDSVVGIRTHIRQGASIRGSVLLGADFYEADGDVAAHGPTARASASAATSCSTASSWTRTRASATARAW